MLRKLSNPRGVHEQEQRRLQEKKAKEMGDSGAGKNPEMAPSRGTAEVSGKNNQSRVQQVRMCRGKLSGSHGTRKQERAGAEESRRRFWESGRPSAAKSGGEDESGDDDEEDELTEEAVAGDKDEDEVEGKGNSNGGGRARGMKARKATNARMMMRKRKKRKSASQETRE